MPDRSGYLAQKSGGGKGKNMNFEHQAVIPEFIITLRHLLRTEAADWKNPLWTEFQAQGTKFKIV